jgi:hypothetical protein
LFDLWVVLAMLSAAEPFAMSEMAIGFQEALSASRELTFF